MNTKPQSARNNITLYAVVVLLLLLLIPNIYAVFRATDLTYSIFKQAVYLTVVIVCLLLPASFLKSRAYFLIEGIFVFIPAPIEIASLYLNRMPASPLFLRVILRTNLREATELLASAIPLVVALLALWTLYFVLVFKIENKWIMPRTMRVVIWCALPITALSGFAWLFHTQRNNNPDRSASEVVRLSAQTLTMKFNKIYPFDIYLALQSLNTERHERNRLAREVENFSFDIYNKTDSLTEVYVLVIGEAARAAEFSINGYSRPTSPCLQAEDNVISFTNAFSSANVTEISVPLMLTRATNYTLEFAYNEKSIVEALQSAGFRTAWFTNKTPFPFTSRIISTTDFSFVNSKGTDADNNYDILLTQKLDNLLNSEFSDSVATHKLFIVLHHTGSHFKYSQRYPEEFDYFRPSLPKDAGYSAINRANRQMLVNAYDNSIRYTDYCLGQVIRLLKQRDCSATVVYMSDHGENLYDDDNNLVLHCSYIGSQYEFNVPFIIWYSEKYKECHPQSVSALASNRSKLVNSDVLFHSLLDMASVPTAYLDSSLSVFSFEYKEPDSVACSTASGRQIFFKRNFLLNKQ